MKATKFIIHNLSQFFDITISLFNIILTICFFFQKPFQNTPFKKRLPIYLTKFFEILFFGSRYMVGKFLHFYGFL